MKYDNKFLLKSFFLLMMATACLIAGYSFDQMEKRPHPHISKEDTAFNVSLQSLNFVTLGHARFLSSLLWILTLLEADIEHYKGDHNSWMYYRFLSITELEPLFYLNYKVGGQYLSIIKDDVLGADHIYQIGVRNFPGDFDLNLSGGFNAAFELKDAKKALSYYEKIVNHPLTQQHFPHIISIVEKLKIQSGQITLFDAYLTLSTQRSLTTNVRLQERLDEHLYGIKAEIDLNCLNSGKENCDTKDYLGDSYIKTKGEWISIRPWKKYKIEL